MLAGEVGAIYAVLEAMRAHVGNAGASERACGAMNNICAKNSALSFSQTAGESVVCAIVDFVCERMFSVL